MVVKVSAENQCSTGLAVRTFYDRMYNCYYFKPKSTYVQGVIAIFERALRTEDAKDILNAFAPVLSQRSYTGPSYIRAEDREAFKTHCIRCAINLDRFFAKFNPTYVMHNYCYKWKVKGHIHGLVEFHDKTYILALSFEDLKITQKDIDFFCINSYLYNATNHTNYDLLVMNVPQEQFWIVPFKDKDYTIQRGFVSCSTKIRKRGEHCTVCANDCKPQYINGLERLDLILCGTPTDTEKQPPD